jgi:hypothetical protein
LFRVVDGGEGFVAQDEVADHGVVQVLGAVSALGDVVAGPPGAEVRVLDGEFTDEFG